MTTARLLLIICAAVLVTGCEVVTGIFKVGFWTGIILVVVVLALVAFLASKLRRR